MKPSSEEKKTLVQFLTSLKERIFQNRANFFLAAALFWFLLMCLLNSLDGKDFAWHDILVEANGMVFDLLVFGVLLTIYENISEKRAKIERLKEEIDDYRGWDEKEAMYRIVGAVKRLNNLGVNKIDLSYCFMNEAKLYGANLQGSNLYGADLVGAELGEVNLNGADLSVGDLSGADMWSANLSDANMHDTILKNAKLSGVNLSSAYLSGANLSGAYLRSANLRNTVLRHVDFKDSNLTKEQLAESASLFECKNLHDSIRIPLEQSHPHLFQEPK